MDKKSAFHLEPAANGRAKVVENSTGLIYRTLDSRSEAVAWVNEAEADSKKR